MNKTIWYTCPSANPNAEECLSKWKKQGYKLFVVGEKDYGLADRFEYVKNEDFRGCVWANNFMASKLRWVTDLIWFGSDDFFPDERYTADEIADIYIGNFPALDGVMEAGDGKLEFEKTLTISPLIGSGYFRTHIPTWPDGYHHFCSDRELVLIAGNKFLNEDRIKFSHKHWSKEGRQQPAYMDRWERLYAEDKAAFKAKWGFDV